MKGTCRLCELTGIDTEVPTDDPEHATYVEDGLILCRECAKLLDYEHEFQYTFNFTGGDDGDSL